LVKNGQQISINTAADGDTHLVNLVEADTTAWDPGRYEYQAWVTNGTDSHMVESGAIVIKPNFRAQANGYDGRTHAEKVLDALEALIEGKATVDQQSYSVGGRSVTRLTPAELAEWRDKYRREVSAQRRRQGPRRKSRSIKVRF
jgi:hypothetical protein